MHRITLSLVFTLLMLPNLTAADPVPDPMPTLRNVHIRGSLDNARIRFEQEKVGHVAFLGGSITEMNGYRPMVCRILQERFPDTKFTFTSAGIASTCSTSGAFRLNDHVMKNGPVDLLFVEFSVNDDQDATHPLSRCIRGMEGIVRHLRAENPNADVVMTYFVNQGICTKRQHGELPTSIDGHRQVAEHYNVSTIDLANEVAQQITEETLTWQKFGGTHPAPYGNAICAQMIRQLMDTAWPEPLACDAKYVAHDTPERLDPFCYDAGQFISPDQADADANWVWATPDWKSLKGQCRTTFVDMKLLSASEPGAELTVKFSGTAVGAYVLAGPDAAMLEYQIDDRPVGQVDLYHRFSGGLHYPRTVRFDDKLPEGEHTLCVKIIEKAAGQRGGTSARIMQFAVNPRGEE